MATPERKKRPTQDPKGRCGTLAGYRAHARRAERPCKACKAANAARARARYHGADPHTLRPSDVVQDQRRGSNGQAVADAPVSARATAPAPRGTAPATGLHSATPKRVDSAVDPAPVVDEAPTVDAPVDMDGVPAAPAFLRAQGVDLWQRVMAEFDLNPAGRVMLGEACRTVDRLERMAAALSSRSTLWFEVEESLTSQLEDGQEFQVVVNGMVGEARQLQAALRSTLKELGITEVRPRAVESDAPRESLQDELKRKRAERLAAAENMDMESNL